MFNMVGISNEPLFSYTISSMDMRYIEIGRRDIYLQSEADGGLIFKGKVAGCGPSCFADLSEILLEYSLSCEGCWDDGEARAKMVDFGTSLAEILVGNTRETGGKLTDKEKLTYLFHCILNSMVPPFTFEPSTSRLVFRWETCPLRESAKNNSLERGIELAQMGFISLCRKIIGLTAPGWILLKPDEQEINLPLTEIIISIE